LRRFVLVGLFGILAASPLHAENLNLKFGPTWSCKILNDLYESCRKCEIDGMHFNQTSSTGGECVGKQSLKGSKYDELPPDLAREREIQQKIDELTREKQALEDKRQREQRSRESGVSGSSRSPASSDAVAKASPSSTMLNMLKARTLTVSSYRMCGGGSPCATSSKPTTLKATEDGKWLLRDEWAHADERPMEPNGSFVRRGPLTGGEWIDSGEVSTTPGQFKLTVNERARSRDRDYSGGWDTTFVTTIDLDPSGNCQFRLEYTTTDFPKGTPRTVRSESAACSVQ
jgi:hypothetical protein